jgi:hypothetical protein
VRRGQKTPCRGLRFVADDKSLAGELGMTAVLHTHTRRLDYHPHVHLVVPVALPVESCHQR